MPHTVDDDGLFHDHVPLFAGQHVYKVDAAVADALNDAGGLLARGRVKHAYPHSWRSKKPLIFRTTPQWFIGMARNALRDKALAAIDRTAFYPESGRNRLRGMIAARPDWCVSRQRAWGVPITVFVDKKTGEPLRDPAVIERVVAAVEAEGADTWFESQPQRFLGDDYDPDDFDQVRDILDVWFDSGASHSFTLETRPDLRWPAALYLEGSDQHRGWFHSSLLEACGTRGRAPYDGVLTHGFVLDEQGRKMSKSLGNVVSPQEVIARYGADILRLWVVASDYSEDLRIGANIIEQNVEAYRRVRNTMRYLLGNLAGFQDSERVEVAPMPELERWVLHRLWELDRLVRQSLERYEFHGLFTALHGFCVSDLSAFYFDIRKDALYCASPDDPTRCAARTVLDTLFSCLTTWLAPILCFTAEEAWRARHGEDARSVHLERFCEVPASWRADAILGRWESVRRVRRVITGAIEVERAEKRIGSSLQAHPQVWVDARTAAVIEGIDLAEIAITSRLTLAVGTPPESAFTLADVPSVGVVVGAAAGTRCERCWRVLPEVGSDSHHRDICGRCADVVGEYGAAAE